MTYTPIQCQLYDYIEIACMRHYTLNIKLLDGEEIQGIAETTRVEDKQEFLIVKSANEEQSFPIRLDKIASITALDKNAEFTMVNIN